MTDTTIATVGDLIAALAAYDSAARVRLATESAEFMDHTIGRVVCTPGDSDSDDCVLPNDAPVVRISTGDSCCCLADSAADALGWS